MSDSLLREAIPNLAGAAMLLLGLLLPVRSRVESAGRLVAAQGGLLALAAASAAWSGEAGRHLWLLALGALVGRALLLPTALRLAAGAGGSRAFRRDSGVGGGPPAHRAVLSLLAGGGLAVLAAAAVLPAGPGLDPGGRGGLALALAASLAGLLAMVPRRPPLLGLLGLISAENGALLAVVHAGGGLPGAAALAVLSPGLVACVALALWGVGAGASLPPVLWARRR